LNAEIINKFINATTEILTNYFNVEVKGCGAVQAIPQHSALDPVTVVLDFTGDLVGQFLVGYSQEVALEIAKAMMMNPEYPQFDDLCRSALAELGNMIGGMSSTGLTELGIACDLTPPLVITGSNVMIQFSVPVLVSLPISSSAGDFRVCVGLKQAG
jgi:chemotaxis protein CheX